MDVILAGALGAIALVVALLFRQLRDLSWQLTQLRVERDSERILRQIGYAGSTPLDDLEVSRPVRRKRHLALYLGGLAGIAATLRGRARQRRGPVLAAARQHRGPVLAAAAGATAAAATALWVLFDTPGAPPPDQGRDIPTVAISPTSSQTARPPGSPTPGWPPTPMLSQQPSSPGRAQAVASLGIRSRPPRTRGPAAGASRATAPTGSKSPPQSGPGSPPSGAPSPTTHPPATPSALLCAHAHSIVGLHHICLDA
ncbi:hypothetical protein ACF1AY_16175 [Streptomyces sp. NPDC014776]|uniref:hypothetical protein n=1 Tax=unclassified Streptomyces TaxID=2593676 RepID=UPI0036F6A421